LAPCCDCCFTQARRTNGETWEVNRPARAGCQQVSSNFRCVFAAPSSSESQGGRTPRPPARPTAPTARGRRTPFLSWPESTPSCTSRQFFLQRLVDHSVVNHLERGLDDSLPCSVRHACSGLAAQGVAPMTEIILATSLAPPDSARNDPYGAHELRIFFLGPGRGSGTCSL
jgi:hypothetical protein